MKKILAMLGGIALSLTFAGTVFAAAPTWDLRGTWTFNDIWSGTTYAHTMEITSFDPVTGVFSGTGFYNDNQALTWNVNGIENGSNITLFHLLVTAVAPGVTIDGTGVINPTGTGISGTGYQSNLPGTVGETNINWTATGIAFSVPPSNKDQCKNDGWKIFNNPTYKNQGECVGYVAKTYGVFTASDSLYYNCPTVCSSIYGTGPISFTWNKTTGAVTGGYYDEIVPPTSGTTYHNIVTGGSVVGNNVNLTFTRTDPNAYGPFYFIGMLIDNVLTGTLDGPYLFTATEL